MEQRFSDFLVAAEEPSTGIKTVANNLGIGRNLYVDGVFNMFSARSTGASIFERYYKIDASYNFEFRQPNGATFLSNDFSTNISELRGNWRNSQEYVDYKAFTDANDDAIIRKDYLTNYVSGVTPAPIKAAILQPGREWANGELYGSQPVGSTPNMRFCDANYRYEYMNGMNDTDGTTFIWTRTIKA